MGLIDKAKSAIGMGDGSSDDIAAEEGWGDEVEDVSEGEMGDTELEGEEDSVDMDQEWDSAYDFVGDHITQAGFVDMVDFIEHAMYSEVEKSPMYRDRIQNGLQTVNQVGDLKETLSRVQGGNEMNLQKKATQVENANKLIDEIGSLQGEDEQMVREITGIAKRYADIAEQKIQEGDLSGTEADVNAEETGERL